MLLAMSTTRSAAPPVAASLFSFVILLPALGVRGNCLQEQAYRGFVGYGDADPSDVSFLVHGAEMRVTETRAVNRPLRKAYGIGICSVEEIGSFAEPPQTLRESKKLPPQPANGNGNYQGTRVRTAFARLSASTNSTQA